MIISHKSKYIFCHIPKTGGSSVEHQLNIHDAVVFGMDVNRVQSNKPLHLALKHLSFSTIKLILGDSLYNEYYKFSIVRNPFDRFISVCWFRGAQNDMERFVMSNNIIGLVPQTKYVCVDGVVNGQIFKYEEGLDNIVRQFSERIHRNNPDHPIIDKITSRIYANIRKDYTHYREVITPSLRKILEKKYESDLELLQYEW